VKTKRLEISPWLIFAVLLGYGAWVVFPMVWVAYSSLKADAAIFRDAFALPALGFASSVTAIFLRELLLP